MKLSKLCSASVFIPVFVFICLLLLLACNDAQEITDGLTAPDGPSLSTEQFSAEYSKEEAIRIFKSGDREAINKVLMSEESVIWDGKSKFKNGVSYSIPEDLNEKARKMNEGFRRLDNMYLEFERTGKLPDDGDDGKKIKKKSSSPTPGLAADGISVDAWVICQNEFRMANAIATVDPHMCRCTVSVIAKAGDKKRYKTDSGSGRYLYAGAAAASFRGGQAFALSQGSACSSGDVAGSSPNLS